MYNQYLYIHFVVSICLYICLQQPFSAPSRSTLANEVPRESSFPEMVKIIFLWPYNQYVVP